MKWTGEVFNTFGRVECSHGGHVHGLMHAEANVIDLAWSAILPIFLQLCADGVGEVRNEAAKATPYILRAAAPEMFVDASGSGVVDGSSGCSSGERQARSGLRRVTVSSSARFVLLVPSSPFFYDCT